MQDDDRRSFMRLSAETSARITHLGNHSNADVKLVDLSASGCSFYTEMTVAAGDELDFVVRGATDSIEPLSKHGRVVRVTDDEQGKLIAFEFNEKVQAP
jgi:c-di-GMP-binding flagellar brake protein YcgR